MEVNNSMMVTTSFLDFSATNIGGDASYPLIRHKTLVRHDLLTSYLWSSMHVHTTYTHQNTS